MHIMYLKLLLEKQRKKKITDNLFPTLLKHVEKGFLEKAWYRNTVVY